MFVKYPTYVLQVEGCEDNIGKCTSDGITYLCGPYNINEPYYIDCGKPGAGMLHVLKHCTYIIIYQILLLARRDSVTIHDY